MSQLETAQRHLTRALRRLEAALEQRLSRTAAGGGAHGAHGGAERAELERSVDALRDQCDRLSVALSEAQHDNRTLREMNGDVLRRLDGSISELDHLLGN